MTTILVTGGSGFVGVHCILQLLAAGYSVRTTVRASAREADVRAMLGVGGATRLDALGVRVADLERDEGWAEACAGCDAVLHVASPFPLTVPAHEDELLVPAREGTLRVLRAARDAGVRRVVLTSSFAAIGLGHGPAKTRVDESDWSVADAPDVQPYAKSKLLAERAAWDFVRAEGHGMELAVVNPVGVVGPALGADLSTSIALLRQLLDGSVLGCPRLFFAFVDVRDVADLHLRAMRHPAAAGERFLAVAGPPVGVSDMAALFRANLGADARRVPRFRVPDLLFRLAALGNPAMRQLVPQLGRRIEASNEKAIRLLGWQPRSTEDALLATARSLVELGLVR